MDRIYFDYNASALVAPEVTDAMRAWLDVGMGAIRFSLGRGTTSAQIDYVVDALRRALA